MTYIMQKKNLTPLYVREKISNPRGLRKKSYPPPRQKSYGNHIGGGEEAGEFDTFSRCHPSAKWLARVHHVVVFQD